MIMKKTLKLMIALVLAGVGAGQAWADSQMIGHITTSATNGTLAYYASKDVAYTDATSIHALSNVSSGVSTENLTAVTVGESTVGYRVYVRATGNFGYTPVGMTPTAEVTTTVMQASRRTAAGDESFAPGQTVEVEAVEGYPGVYSFVMPNDPNLNVSITADFAAKATNPDALAYIDASGTEQSRDAGTVYVLDGTESGLGQSDAETWYVCTTAATANEGNGLEYNRELRLNGTVHLILADGSKMSVTNNYDGIRVYGGDGLTIYGQGGDSGLLSVTANGTLSNGINTGKKHLTINGGTVDINATGIGLKATGIVINGGIVDIEAADDGINAKDIAINGGQVTATTTGTGSNRYGINANSVDHPLKLGFRKAGDFIQATSYRLMGSNNTMIIKDGQIMKYGSNDTKLMGTYSRDALAALAGQKLTPYGIGGYCGATSENDGKNVVWAIPLDAPDTDIDESKTLYIEGTGAMATFNGSGSSTVAPWIRCDNYGIARGLKYPVTSVVIADGVTSVGKYAFSGCSGLTSATIGNGVTIIDDDAFANCSGLTTVTIGSGVTYIQADAFLYCTDLTTVFVNRYVPNDDNPITPVDKAPFKTSNNLALILVPDEAAYNAYYNADESYGWDALVNNIALKYRLAPKELTVAKNASGWNTYCHRYPVSYSSDGVDVYYVTSISQDGTSVNIAQNIVSVNAGSFPNHVCPQGSQLLNYVGGTGSITLTANPATATTVNNIPDIVSQNNTDWVIYGNTTAIDHAAADCSFINKDGYTSYMLYNGEFVRINNNGGLAAHRCVLNVANSTTGSARVLTIGETTSIRPLSGSPEGESKEASPRGGLEGVWYTLDGRKVSQPTAKGIYIYNGIKRVVK